MVQETETTREEEAVEAEVVTEEEEAAEAEVVPEEEEELPNEEINETFIFSELFSRRENGSLIIINLNYF
jgi:hypothetical protein